MYSLDKHYLKKIRTAIRRNLVDCSRKNTITFFESRFYLKWNHGERELGLHVSQACKCIRESGWDVFVTQVNNKFSVFKKDGDDFEFFENKDEKVYRIVIKKIKKERIRKTKK